MSLEDVWFGRLARSDGVLGQAKLDPLGEDIEQVDWVAGRIMALFAGLAIDGDDLAVAVGDHAAEPLGKGLLELSEREAGQDPAEGRGMGRLLPGAAEWFAEAVPEVVGPTLQGGQFGLAAH